MLRTQATHIAANWIPDGLVLYILPRRVRIKGPSDQRGLCFANRLQIPVPPIYEIIGRALTGSPARPVSATALSVRLNFGITSRAKASSEAIALSPPYQGG